MSKNKIDLSGENVWIKKDYPVLKDVAVNGNKCSFRVGDLPQIVMIELKIDPKIPGQIMYRQSHVIHTPNQAGGYRTSRPWAKTIVAALRLAIEGIVSRYEEAIKEGEKPDPSWLEQY